MPALYESARVASSTLPFITPPRPPPYSVQYNVSYGDGDCSECPSCSCYDLYTPARASAKRLVVFAHGGLWYSGSRAEINEVCTVLASSHGVACATIDYTYSKDLGGCCSELTCNETYSRQASALASAVAHASTSTSHGFDEVMLGGHSAGGHLSLLLSLRWSDYAPGVKVPDGFFGCEGIYNVSLWDDYDEAKFEGRYRCQNREAFGMPAFSPAWTSGSPTSLAVASAPAGPSLVIHSPGDDYVQQRQAIDLIAALKPPPHGKHQLDIAGVCVQGQHEDVLTGASAKDLAECLARFDLGR